VLAVGGEFKNYSFSCAHVQMEKKSEREED
jgi:hypothetical protein